MKIPRIVNAVGQLDDALIVEASREKKVKRRAWLKWGSIAACLAVMLMAVAIVVPMMLDGDGLPPSGGGEIMLEKYYDYRINGGAFASYIGGNVIAEDRVGGKIEDVSVTAGWRNAAHQWLSVETLNAEIYAIEGVERNVAVALKFIDKGEAVTTTHYYVILHPNAEYNGTLFPDYKTENPVRYLEESTLGKSNGWQDFGTVGEIRTVTVPIGSTYVYQMYAYYLRNDLSHIYPKEALPETLAELPAWLTDTLTAGRRSFWYSMGGRLPERITLEATTAVTSENGAATFIRAEYKVHINNGSDERVEDWVIYLMEENGVYSAYAVVANENFEFVRSYTESIVKSYREKQ